MPVADIIAALAGGGANENGEEQPEEGRSHDRSGAGVGHDRSTGTAGHRKEDPIGNASLMTTAVDAFAFDDPGDDFYALYSPPPFRPFSR